MKVRCSGDTPKCANCQRRNKQCIYSSKAASSTTETSSSRDDVASMSQVAISPELQRASVDSSPQSHTLDSTIGEDMPSIPDELVAGLATVIQRCRDKTIDRALQLAICAITATYFDKHQDERHEWAHEAESLIIERLEEPSIFKIQASLLLIRYRAAVGQFPRAFIMAGLTARWTVALRLNYEHSKLSPVAQEVRRRTFWSLYLLEDSFCVGIKEFELFDSETIHLQLPCEDEDFHQERHVATGYLQPGKGLEPEVLGPRAALVRLAFVRRVIIRLNRRISMKEVNLQELFYLMERFQNDLLRLKTKLAPHDQYPPSNPGETHPSPVYAITHMSWHQCHCDLYRIFLTEFPDSTPHASIEGPSASEKALMKEKCLYHAEQIVDVLSYFAEYKNEKDMLEFDAAICAYHSARLILFGTYTSRDNTGLQMQTAISKAQLCLDMITQYFAFSAQLKSMRQELERVLQQHKLWLDTPGHRVVATTDPAPPPKLSKDAYIRQRLAIHSLLRQSDFVDDSRDAAPEPGPEPTPGWTPSVENEPGSELHAEGNRTESYPFSDPLKDPMLLFGMSHGGLDLDAWVGNELGAQYLSKDLVDYDEQYMY
ncbi:NirA-like nitrate assimilation regulatory protein [Fusarium heterosporum]|uniref:NirA-like nitrate assimilation regulatory protein n=1 Tax=Fusarium heterosporum TaxID=42747 RepID=A0A8H5TRI3_FUSHE|nr:NirA-like nitrate assimilation regulatory protein [Fusarium heterosporum]